MNIENTAGKNIPNILIVDDIPANLKVLGGILKEKGYKIRPVLSGELALQVAEKEISDLILLDIMMPGMDGYEVCRQLKGNPKLKEIPVIFISALNDTKDIVNAFAVGGVDYITKPFQVEEVTVRVATHLKICRQNIELRELNATKDKFFSIIAHDLRGPIGTMMQISEFIAGKGNVDNETLYTFLESQKELSRNTFYLLENLLSWARSNTNQIDFYPEILEINTIIKTCIDNNKLQSMNKNIEVTSNFEERCYAFADQKMFRLIIRNLLSNAIKFTPQRGTICISTSSEENNLVVIEVKDNGIGMSNKIIENLFNMDINSNRPGTDGESSSGLGLMLCKEFVEKNNGKIGAESEEGKGSIFRVTLPSSGNTI